MKNSQYVNQFDISINDLVRLKFSEIIPAGDGKQEIVEIILLSLHGFAAKAMAELIIKTVNEHEQNTIENNKKLS